MLAEYADHLPLTVRQIFYRLVGTSGGYEKTELAYKRLYEATAKHAGGALIEFDAIRDDGAVREDPFGYAGIESLMRRFDYIVNNYRLDRQIGQPVHTIAACEAAGMVPQLARVADPFGVPVLSGGGFDSITAKHALAQEIADSDRPVRLLHIGDHDPTWVHMFSALDQDVRAFLTKLNKNAQVIPERVAILPEHVARFSLQTAPAKTTDGRRFEGIGDDPNATVQAEALAPDDLAALFEAALHRGWDEHASARLAERKRKGDERDAPVQRC